VQHLACSYSSHCRGLKRAPERGHGGALCKLVAAPGTAQPAASTSKITPQTSIVLSAASPIQVFKMTSYADKGEQVSIGGARTKCTAPQHFSSNSLTMPLLVCSPTMASSLASTTFTGGLATPRWLVSSMKHIKLRRFGLAPWQRVSHVFPQLQPPGTLSAWASRLLRTVVSRPATATALPGSCSKAM